VNIVLIILHYACFYSQNDSKNPLLNYVVFLSIIVSCKCIDALPEEIIRKYNMLSSAKFFFTIFFNFTHNRPIAQLLESLGIYNICNNIFIIFKINFEDYWLNRIKTK